MVKLTVKTNQLDLPTNKDGKLVIRILKIGQMKFDENGTESAMWCDFVEVPQGYVHVCGTGIRKPKYARKFPSVNGVLVDPTDEQIITQAKTYLARNLNPDDFEFVVTDKDFRGGKN